MTATAESTLDLLPDLCGQFQQATGWKLRFRSAAGPLDDQLAVLESDPACRWYAGVSDGFRPAGLLWLESPDAGDERMDLDQAAGLAEGIARLLDRLAEAASQLTLRNRDVATLLNLGLAIPAQDDLAFSISQLLKAATHLTNSRSAAFFLLDSATGRLNLRALYQLSRSDIGSPERELVEGSPDLKALSEGPVVLRADRPGGLPLLPTTMQVALAAGVQSEQVPFGTLWVFDRRDKNYSQRDRHVLQSIAAQMAAVLERSALLHNSVQQERISRDLEAASRNQCDITPDNLPVDARYEIAARCTSCYELGGDLCEVVELDEARVGLAVGDASGNSIPAAMIMSAVRGALRTHPADADEVALRMAEINNALCRITHAHQFMSLCYGVFDPTNFQFVYCNAGHPAPLLIRDGQAMLLGSHGLLLGVLPDTEYDFSAIALDRGDLLVLYSDGISEARGDRQELFKVDGIVEAARRELHGSAQQVLDMIWTRVETHLSDSRAGDDRTLLVLKVK